MKKLMYTCIIAALALAAPSVNAAGSSGKTITDAWDSWYYEYTKRDAPSSLEYVSHSNVTTIASTIASKYVADEKTNKVWDAQSLPTQGKWLVGGTIKDYIDFIWSYSISELEGKEEALYTYVDESIYGPKATLTQEQIRKGIGFNGSGVDENSPIEIGRYAKAAIDTNIIAAVTTPNTKIRNAGIAIGAHATTEGATDIKNQNIAIGLAAHAKGSSIVAIGPGAKEKTETDLTGNNTYAQGSAATSIGYSVKAFGTGVLAIGSGDSGTNQKPTIASNNYAVAVGPAAQALAPKAIATGRYASATAEDAIADGTSAQARAPKAVSIGRDAVTTAEGAVQIGKGTNSVANTLKYQDVTLVKNGRLATPQAEPNISEWNAADAEQAKDSGYELNPEPGSINTILPQVPLEPGMELYLNKPNGSLRNYELYLPNEAEMRPGLPVSMMFQLDDPGIKTLVLGERQKICRLPAKIKVTQPYAKLLIAEFTEFDDGTDWDPVITKCDIVYDLARGSFMTTNTQHRAVEGTNLHECTSFKFVYPTSSTAAVTNELVGTTISDDSPSVYEYVFGFEYKPGTPVSIDSNGNSWFEIILETAAGKKPASIRKDFNITD